MFLTALVSLAITGAQLTFLTKWILKRETTLSSRRSVELIMIESLRAMAATLLRLPLLILPAIYEWIRLTPVPFLVLLDDSYARGEKDILNASREFFRNHRLVVFGFVILSSVFFAIEFAFTSDSAEALPIWQDPLRLLPMAGICVLHLFLDLAVVSMFARALDHGRASKVS